MKRSTRLAALIAALMLLAACMSATPSWALLGPIKEQEPESIGEPTEPGRQGASYAPPNDYGVSSAILSPSAFGSFLITWRIPFLRMRALAHSGLSPTK